MQRTNKILAMTALKVVFAIAIAQITAALMFGQDIRNTDYNPDKTLKSNARVNPSTLAMELSIPISGFPGRAGNGMPVAFNYSSKVWEFQHVGAWPSSAFGVTTGVNPKFAKRTAAGWSSSLGTPRIDYTFDWYRDRSDALINDGTYEGMIYSPEPWQEPGANEVQVPLYYIKRVNVQMPDGSSHEFRASDAPIACGDMDDSACTAADLTGTFLSVDGSKMRLEVAQGSSTLYLPDGGRYVFGTYPGSHRPNNSSETDASLAHTFIDRHGNRMTYNSTTHVWIDTLGRNITDPFPTNWTNSQLQAEGTQNAAFPSFGSNNMEVKFTWSHLKDPDGTNHALDDTNEVPHNVSSAFCQGNLIHDVTGPFLFLQTSPVTVICGPGFTEQGPPFNPVVLTKIELPNGQSYQFKYNVFGEVVRIIYPTGAYERFAYQEVTSLTPTADSYYLANRGVSDRWLSSTGNPIDEVHWSYTASRGTFQNPTPYTVTTFSPDGTKTEQFIHDQRDPNEKVFYGFSDAKVGRSFEDRVYSSGNPRQLLRRNLTEYEETEVQTGLSSTYPKTATRDMRPTKQISITFEPGSSYALAAMTETVYDTSGNSDPAYFSSLNPKQQKTYDYVVVSAATAASANLVNAEGWFASATPKVVTEMDYLYDANYMARNITSLVTETRVKDAAGNVKAKTQISYDESGYEVSSTGTMPTAAANSWLNPVTELGATIGAKRGLPTTVKSYYDIATSSFIATHSFYDQYGNLRVSRDGRGNDTTTAYDPTYAFAYPTSVTTAVPDPTGTHGSATAFTTTSVYDFNTGLPTSVTDANGQTTSMEYVDPLLRPTKTTAPNGQQTTTEYGAGTSASTRWVKVKSQIDATDWKEAVSWFDGLGRSVRSQSVDAQSGDVFTLTCYDNMGRVSKATNPFRGWTTQDCETENGTITDGQPANGSNQVFWTSSEYDDLGRTVSVTTPDSAVVTTAYSLATSGSQIGTAVTVTDQAGKLRRSITNGIGQLTRVDEPNASNQLGAVDNPNQDTTYDYDLLNNLTTVNQGVQTRTFSYDNLSRLESAVNPESGTINYTYDANGNLATKVDARNITTSYVYDALNRVTQRNYTNEPTGSETADVSYYYDLLSNAKGKLIKVSSSVSTTEYTAFDILGRVTDHKQTTDGEEYATEYTYNLSGALIEETYPSGRKVKNTLDADGSLSQVQSRTASDTFKNYVNSFVYTAAGAVSALRLGNGRWENTQFNERLQPTMIGLGSGATSQNLLKLNYDYGTTDNNGNVKSQTITVNRSGQSPLVFDQTYTYDSLNRITSAEEKTGTTTNWMQAYIFDRYGNRNFDEANTTTITKNCGTSPNFVVCTADIPAVNPVASASTNRLNDYTYDAAGNTIIDAEGRQFTYDAENKQTEVENSLSQTVGEYFYDGDGKRIKKYVPSTGETTIFVYDAGGKLIGEYSTNISLTPQTQYLTSDHLGTPRVNTDQLGNVVSRTDYMPYGEEIIALGGRTSSDKYVADDVRQGFTGYENDAETELDYAQARMYSNGLGRFSGADPFNIVLEIKAEKDPKKAQSRLLSYLMKAQQWNRYSYVANNPMVFVDPSGEELELTGTQEEQDRSYKRILDLCGEKCAGRLYIDKRDGRTLVKYFDDKGGLAGNAGDIGQVLEDIINSNITVEFQVTNKSIVTTADGSTENINLRGGGVTSIFDNKVQIFVSATVGADFSFHAARKGFKAEDGTILTATNSVGDAHEFGHAWGAIKDNFMERYNKLSWYQSASQLYKENDKRSLQVDNWQRDRLGLPHRTSH